MSALSISDTSALLDKLISLLPSYKEFPTMVVEDLQSFTPTFSVFGNSWNLGSIFSRSNMSWGEFAELANSKLSALQFQIKVRTEHHSGVVV